MKQKLIIAFFLIILSNASCRRKATTNPLGDNLTIKEGVGVNDLNLTELTISEVHRKLGEEFETVNHNGYSNEFYYSKYGISFWTSTGHSDVFSISFKDSFKGQTSQGFSIKNMTVSDMLKIYGKPRWSMLESSKMLFAHYDSLGIYFEIKPKGETPFEILSYYTDDTVALKRIDRFYDSVYHNDKIAEISIGIPGTEF